MTILRIRRCGWSVAWLLLTSAAGFADVPGQIWKKGDNRPLTGAIRYLPASKTYVVTGKGGAALNIPLAEVGRISVEKPAGMDAATQMVNAGRFAQAIPVLQKIAADYKMLEWDAVATRYLAQATLKAGQPADAVTICEQIIADNPAAAYSGEMAPVYWEALLQAGRESALLRALGKAVESGDRVIAAQAQIKRGDILKKKGNPKEALVDGYLRVVTLFQSVEQVQPEALFKAMQCFEELKEPTHAERMRKLLLGKYPQSEWAQQAKTGA